MHELPRILYVEDEPDIQMVASIPLRIAGYELEICDSGQEALGKAPAFKPDLILLDVMMPGLDGPATLERLRQLDSTRDTPVVFMTAKTQRQEIDQFLKLGALAVIMKPFDPMALAGKIREIWRNFVASTGKRGAAAETAEAR